MIVLGYNGFARAAEIFSRLYNATGIDRNLIYGHDSSAAIIVDGKLVAAAEEERFNREKRTSAFPAKSIEWCLNQVEATFDDVDVFAFAWQFSDDVLEKMIHEIVDDQGLTVSKKLSQLGRLVKTYDGMLSITARIHDFADYTGFEIPLERLMPVPHHLCHLLTGHILSQGGDSAFLVSDGRAEWLSAIIGEISNGKVRMFEDLTVSFRNSLAVLFSVITRYLGFMPNNDEYKVMGLAAYGQPPCPNPLLDKVLKLDENGTYTTPFPAHDVGSYYELFDHVFAGTPEVRESFEYRVRVAAAAQDLVEQVTHRQIEVLQKRTDAHRLVFEGGLALNCVNNTKILEQSSFDDVHVSFGASDVGVSIGAAFQACMNLGMTLRISPSPYLGPSYGPAEIQAALTRHSDHIVWRQMADPIQQTVDILEREQVVAWFQGRMEFGPRALGNRSILANPSFPGIKDTINNRVKHREPFRPFAPIVLEDVASTVFEMGKKQKSPYMTFVMPVRPQYQQVIQGACHVDMTSRVQTVSDSDNPLLAELLREFTARTGIPCLINTSFNVAGEPIVCSPDDAIQCFLSTEIDYLVLGDILVERALPAMNRFRKEKVQ